MITPEEIPGLVQRMWLMHQVELARFDIIDVRERLRSAHGDLLNSYPRHLYHSFHTTAGYLEQSLAATANFFFASASHFSNSGFASATTLIGMKAWLTPQIWLHSP